MKTVPIDKTKPYGEIVGNSIARYEQGGRYYNAHFEQCDIDGNILEPREKEPEILIEDDEDETPVKDNILDTLEAMHYKHIMKLVVKNGGQWTNKGAAIKYLMGLEAPDLRLDG